MIGLILVSHGRVGEVLLRTASEIVGEFDSAESLTIERYDDCEQVHSQLEELIRKVDQGQGVIILADMFGGTACNISLRLVESYKIEVVTGMNLPMLLKLNIERLKNTDVSAVAQLVKYYGQRNIMVAGDVLKEREL